MRNSISVLQDCHHGFWAVLFLSTNYANKVNQRRCLEESGQWLENADQTHLAQFS